MHVAVVSQKIPQHCFIVHLLGPNEIIHMHHLGRFKLYENIMFSNSSTDSTLYNCNLQKNWFHEPIFVLFSTVPIWHDYATTEWLSCGCHYSLCCLFIIKTKQDSQPAEYQIFYTRYCMTSTNDFITRCKQRTFQYTQLDRQNKTENYMIHDNILRSKG